MSYTRLLQGDCLEEMDKLISEGIIVDAVITDPPYGTTDCEWDSVIPFESMWERLNKLIKPNGAVILFGSEPFSSALRISNIKKYRYDIIWEKERPVNIFFIKKQIGKVHEVISIFYNKQPTYNPIMSKSNGFKNGKQSVNNDSSTHKKQNYKYSKDYNCEVIYPRSILKINRDRNKMHPTQKPVALMEYLIKTYTNENDTVLDFTMGSGTTGVACKILNRNFIGIELDKDYFEIAKERINNPVSKSLF